MPKKKQGMVLKGRPSSFTPDIGQSLAITLVFCFLQMNETVLVMFPNQFISQPNEHGVGQ